MGKGILAAWLCVALLTPVEASAQARGPSAREIQENAEPERPLVRAEKLAELEVWLRRLVGKYRVTSVVTVPDLGIAETLNSQEELLDCIAVGDGPGVQCMWGGGGADFDHDSPGGSALLFGLDPDALRINFLWVNRRGLANGGLARLSGNTLSSRLGCKLPDFARGVVYCEIKLQFYANSGIKSVDISSEMIERLMTPRGIRDMPPIVTRSWLRRVPDLDPREKK